MRGLQIGAAATEALDAEIIGHAAHRDSLQRAFQARAICIQLANKNFEFIVAMRAAPQFAAMQIRADHLETIALETTPGIE